MRAPTNELPAQIADGGPSLRVERLGDFEGEAGDLALKALSAVPDLESLELVDAFLDEDGFRKTAPTLCQVGGGGGAFYGDARHSWTQLPPWRS